MSAFNVVRMRVKPGFEDQDLGGGLGVTDPVSGAVIVELKP